MPKILIIDDDAPMRGWLAAVLQGAGYDVETMPDGEDAARLLKLGIIDLALIDYHLPGKDGLTMVRELCAAKNATPVVMITANGSQQLAVQAFRAGAMDFVAKPIDPDYLKIVVERTLNAGARNLKNAAFRALGYMHHKPGCAFHEDGQSCDCGLKELFEDIEEFS